MLSYEFNREQMEKILEQRYNFLPTQSTFLMDNLQSQWSQLQHQQYQRRIQLPRLSHLQWFVPVCILAHFYKLYSHYIYVLQESGHANSV